MTSYVGAVRGSLFESVRRAAVSNTSATLLIGGSALGAAVFLLIGFAIIGWLRVQAWQQTERETTKVVALLTDRLHHQIEQIDLMLMSRARIMETQAFKSASLRDKKSILFDGVSPFDIGELRVLSFYGDISYSSGSADTSVGDHLALLQHAHSSVDRLHISDPYRDGQAVEIVLSRRFMDGSSFGGVVTARITSEQLADLFETVQLDANDTITLLYDDKRLVYRSIDGIRSAGRDVSQTELARATTAASAGSIKLKGTVDGVPRLYVHSLVEGFPLRIYYGRSIEALDTAFWAGARWIVALLGAAAALQVIVTIFLTREFRLRRQYEIRLEVVAETDGLTQIANRRRFDEALLDEWHRSARSGQPVGLIMLDADHFKKYNDKYGHPAGDKLLQELARQVAKIAKRSTDVAARFGGEEFAILLPGIDTDAAVFLAEQLREAIEEAQIPHADHPSGRVTVSLGVASTTGDMTKPATDLVSKADEALYAAKRLGRNRVEVFRCVSLDARAAA